MSADNIPNDYQSVRQSAGYFYLKDWRLVKATGTDALNFLQTQTTNDVLQLQIGKGQNSAIVDRKAKIVATFSIHRFAENSVFLLVENTQKSRLLQHLETYHFREDVVFESELPQNSLLALQGPKSPLALKNRGWIANLPEKPNDILQAKLNGAPVFIVNKSFTGEEGFILVYGPESASEISEKIIESTNDAHPIAPISPDTWETLRIEAGVPLYGKDMSEKFILPETGLEHSSVSYNKGCYIGQEVIARIKTYGSPAVALMGAILDGDVRPAPDSAILLNQKKIGTIKSSCHSPHLGKTIALAYLQKDYRSPDSTWEVEIDAQTFKLLVQLLPFYQPQTSKDHAQKLLDEALNYFKKEDDLETPIRLLREAIELDPKNARAYESLGVLLAKQEKFDEAIALMKRLAEIDPEEIMAHTNLSIYYMKLGRIEDAENEKAEATALQFEKLMMAGKAKKNKAQEEAQQKVDLVKKIDMFNQVLEIDPVDQVANFGLGSVYYELGEYSKAVPPLQTLLREYKDYSAAYLILGKNLEKLEQYEEAANIYKEGVAAASRKGDLMPLKEMQTRMNQILHSTKGP